MVEKYPNLIAVDDPLENKARDDVRKAGISNRCKIDLNEAYDEFGGEVLNQLRPRIEAALSKAASDQ